MECNMKYFLIVSIFILPLISQEIDRTFNSNPEVKTNASKRILSRRKRYLTFPDGSSLQLVYCLTVPIIGYATGLTFGGTASLAWELPSEPYRFHKDRQKIIDSLSRRVDKSDIKTSGGWTVQNPQRPIHIEQKTWDFNPFARKYPPPTLYNTIRYNQGPISNSPAFRQSMKRKYYHYPTGYKVNSYRYKNNYLGYDPFEEYQREFYHKLHRRTKRDLYIKIIDFFRAMSKDGKACLSKAICEVSQAPNDHSGAFIEEIIKAIFRYKPHQDYENEDEYDEAYNKTHNCTEMYPTCNSSVWNNFF